MGLEARGTDRARNGEPARKGELARKGTKSSMSHQKGSRVKAEMGAFGLGSNKSLKRFLGWKTGSPAGGNHTWFSLLSLLLEENGWYISALIQLRWCVCAGVRAWVYMASARSERKLVLLLLFLFLPWERDAALLRNKEKCLCVEYVCSFQIFHFTL